MTWRDRAAILLARVRMPLLYAAVALLLVGGLLAISLPAGSVLAECGNSGNSTQPHLHFQVQDRRSTLIAAGRPVTFRAARDSTGRPLDVPKAEQVVQFDPPRPREPFLRL